MASALTGRRHYYSPSPVNYPITTRDECRVYESPLLISALRKEKYKRQFSGTWNRRKHTNGSSAVRVTLRVCVFPYVFGGQAATSDTDIDSLLVSVRRYAGLLIVIPFNAVLGPMFKLNEIHMEELREGLGIMRTFCNPGGRGNGEHGNDGCARKVTAQKGVPRES